MYIYLLYIPTIYILYKYIIGNNADVNTNNTNFLKSNNTNIVLNTDIMNNNNTSQVTSVNPHTNFLTSGNNKRTINHISTSNLINGSESDGTKDTMSDD